MFGYFFFTLIIPLSSLQNFILFKLLIFFSNFMKYYEKTKGKDYSKRHGELLLQLEDVKNRFKSIVFELWVSDKIDFIKKVGKDGRTYFV